MGYAFINIIDRKDIVSFFKDFNNQKWKLFKSGKVYFSLKDLPNKVCKNIR